jgi:ATP-dependent RNA helicase DHX8/PRP22
VDAKIAEYQAAMRSIRRAMLRVAEEGVVVEEEEAVDVFGAVQFGEVDFARVHKIVLRECRRLKEGLPIYAYRRRILNHIFTNQVTMDDWNSLCDFVSRELQCSVNYLKAFG